MKPSMDFLIYVFILTGTVSVLVLFIFIYCNCVLLRWSKLCNEQKKIDPEEEPPPTSEVIVEDDRDCQAGDNVMVRIREAPFETLSLTDEQAKHTEISAQEKPMVGQREKQKFMAPQPKYKPTQSNECCAQSTCDH